MRKSLSPLLTGSVLSFVIAIAGPHPEVCSEQTAGSQTQRPVSYSRDIQPLFAKHCVVCHGPDVAEAGLRLDVREAAVGATDSAAAAIVAGDPTASELLRRVSSTDLDERMPPEGEPLSAAEVDTLRQWIAAGAKFETHWAYRPIAEPELPEVEQAAWVRNAIDRFVLHRLETAGLPPSPPADPATIVKRLHYDLIGLPPEPTEVDAFLADPSDRAYEGLVDRLLASEHFGERWGRHWLDKARYADSDGYEKDRPRPNAWRYRDWVISAINRDLPYDRFTIEQLAGDLLPDADENQLLATAFHRQTLTNTEGGVDQEEFRVEATFDRTETTGAVWLGLTMTCARCHTHKYDQISQREYYQFFAFFDDANESTIDVVRDPVALEEYHQAKRRHEARVDELRSEYLRARAALTPRIDRWTREMTRQLSETEPRELSFHPAEIVEASSAGKAQLEPQADGSLLVTGPVPDKDRYTLVIQLPETPIAGIRLHASPAASLPDQGPGRAANGNFVITHLDGELSADRDFADAQPVAWSNANADFSQNGFRPSAVFDPDPKSGWAIGSRMGKPHAWTGYTSRPHERGDHRWLRLVIDQQYGGKHVLGHFRIELISGFDPAAALPTEVIASLRTPAEQRSGEQQETLVDYVASFDPQVAPLAERLAALRKSAPKKPLMRVRVLKPANRDTRLLHRGDFLQPADAVQPGTLEVILRTHPLAARDSAAAPDRLDLARWLVDPQHPLTPRVAVNHVWGQLFGRGLVPTLNDFGVRGELPTHPALLDWLAWHFPRDLGWSRKALVKTMVMSATYRQSSHHRDDLQQADPTNRLLARQNRVRVAAEIVRDLHLDVSGLLSRKVGGPSVFPPLPPGVAELSYANNFKWKTSQGEDKYRRGMYTFFKRTSPHPTLTSFDCPDSNTTSLQRPVSNTPLQALATLNNEVFTEAAEALSKRVLESPRETDRQRLRYALRLCLSRHPHAAEVDRFQQLLESAREYYADGPDDAQQLVTRHPAAGVPATEQAAWVATLRMVLNLDEFIVRD